MKCNITINIKTIIIVLMILFAGISNNSYSQILEQDFDALVALYNNTNGDVWNDPNYPWNTSVNNVKTYDTLDNTSWYGVTLAQYSEGRRVHWIRLLNRTDFIGELPSEISQLEELQELSIVVANDLTGPLPTGIGNLTNLKYLQLIETGVGGALPTEIGNLTSLEGLFLIGKPSGGNFSGAIPPEIGSLSSLTELFLSSNKFTGTLPDQIGNLTNLTKLSVNSNNLSGALPATLANLAQLKSLNISNNKFTSLPDLSAITNLKIRASNNKLTFEFLEPIADQLTDYAVQDTVLNLIPEEILLNQNNLLELTISTGGASNQYRWLRNGVEALSANSSPDFTIARFSAADTGYYYCQITNLKLPGLSFRTDSVHITYNYAPEFNLPLTTVDEDFLYSFNVVISDKNNDAITITNTSKPDWITKFTDNGNGTATITGTPTNDDVGTVGNVLTITANDGHIASPVILNYTINVSNTNDAPSAINLDNKDADENMSTKVGTLSTTDDDTPYGDTHSYNIIGGNPDGLFSIMSSNELYIWKADYEKQQQHTIIIETVDLAGASHSDEFIITINNRNDPPIFDFMSFETTEGLDIGTYIGDLLASDIEGDSFVFEFVDPPYDYYSNDKFVIEGNKLKTTKLLDYETEIACFIYVKVVDESDPSSFSTKSLSINIKNINDVPVDFFFDNSILNVDENSKKGIKVGEIIAVDEDNMPIVFSMEYNKTFEMNSTTGMITVAENADIDFETLNIYTFSIYVSDGKFSDKATVTINVNDVNDQPPYFTNSPYSYTIVENLAYLTELATVKAIDPEGLSLVTYSIITPDAPISIDPVSGVLKVKNQLDLDYETSPQIIFTVNVSDGLFNAQETVTLNLTNVNDKPTLDIVNDINIPEDAGQQIVLLSGITDGDPNDKQNISIKYRKIDNLGLLENINLYFTEAGDKAILSYTTKANASGTANIKIILKDDGGIPGIDSTVNSFNIIIAPINDRPVLTIPVELTTTEFENTPIVGLEATDVDIYNNLMLIELWVGQGTMSLSTTTGLIFGSGKENNNSNIEFRASQWDANAALQTLVYKSYDDYVGKDYINITVSDLGASGEGGIQTKSGLVRININAVPPAIKMQPISVRGCTGGDAVFSVQASGTSLQYKWKRNGYRINGETSNTLTLTDLSSYNVATYTCEIYNSAQRVTTDAVTLQLAPLSMSLASEDIRCKNEETGKIEIQANGGFNNLGYFYSIDGTNFYTFNVFDNLDEGEYTVIVEDEVFCRISKSITINEPKTGVLATVNATDNSCKNGNDGTLLIKPEGGEPDYNIIITPKNYENITKLNSGFIRYSNLTAAEYSINVIDANNCTFNATQQINEPEGLNLNLETKSAACDNENIEVNFQLEGGTAPYHCSWKNLLNNDVKFEEEFTEGDHSVNSIYETIVPGNYTMFVTDINGCNTEKTINIEKKQNLQVEILNFENEYCEETNSGTIELKATGGTLDYRYSIDNKNYQTNSLFENLNLGHYNFTVLDANDCSAKVSLSLDAEIYKPKLDIYYIHTREGTRFFNFSINIDSCFWDFGDGNTHGWLSSTSIDYAPRFWDPIHLYENSGIYEATFTAKNQCATNTEVLTVEAYATGIEQNQTSDAINIYPNPSDGKFYISTNITNNTDITNIKIKNIAGQIIYSKDLQLSNNKSELDISNQAAGVYFIELTAGEKQFVRKITIR